MVACRGEWVEANQSCEKCNQLVNPRGCCGKRLGWVKLQEDLEAGLLGTEVCGVKL